MHNKNAKGIVLNHDLELSLSVFCYSMIVLFQKIYMLHLICADRSFFQEEDIWSKREDILCRLKYLTEDRRIENTKLLFMLQLNSKVSLTPW